MSPLTNVVRLLAKEISYFAEEMMSALGASRFLIQRYERRLESAPEEADVIRRLARLYERSGVPARAIALHERLLRTATDKATTHLELAGLYEQVGHDEAARDHYRSFLELDKESDPAFRQFISNRLSKLG